MLTDLFADLEPDQPTADGSASKDKIMAAQRYDKMRANERYLAAFMASFTNDAILDQYHTFDRHVRRMEQTNNYRYLEESYEYAKLRRDDYRNEARKRTLL